MRRATLLSLIAALLSLVALTGVAQAVVVNGAGGKFGLALVPKTPAEDPTVGGYIPASPGGSCTDPLLPPDLNLGSWGLCYEGGAVLHSNTTFALTWDVPTPTRRYWDKTRGYMEQFLRDVADGSGTLTSPYAVTPQYSDSGGRAANSSTFGGGCIDLGSAGGFTCHLSGANPSGTGTDLTSGCGRAAQGSDPLWVFPDGSVGSLANDICITDAQIKAELSSWSGQLPGYIHPGTSQNPVAVVLVPPRVEVCLDSSANLCSANGGGSATQFCSYHAQANGLTYVVVPWTPFTQCNEPGVPALPSPPSADDLATYVGALLVSPLSQAHIASIVNPGLNGWYALDGSEINDNGSLNHKVNGQYCRPYGGDLDKVTAGSSAQNPYFLQREWNNAGALESDVHAPGCAPDVRLDPAFPVPNPVSPGDLVEFDGSATISTLMVHKADYHWDFGDGSTGVGPSVAHTYASDGTYHVTLTVTDRGNYSRTLTETIQVGPASSPPGGPNPPGGTTHPPGSVGPKFASLALLPQSLSSVLRHGMAVSVNSSRAADGITTIWIGRGAAKRAHIRLGHGARVAVGRGTVRIHAGKATLHLHLSKAMAAKLKNLRHVTLTVRMVFVAANGDHFAIDAAGRY